MWRKPYTDCMKTTIYIPDEKSAIYERAKTELGDSISATFVKCLERELEAKSQSTDRIVVELRDENGRTTRKAFVGRWLVGSAEDSENFWFDKDTEGVSLDGRHQGFSVALTKAGRFAVVSRGEESDYFEVYDDFARLSGLDSSGYPAYPKTLIRAVASEMGVDVVEELDI